VGYPDFILLYSSEFSFQKHFGKCSDCLGSRYFDLAIVHSLVQLAFGGSHKGGSGGSADDIGGAISAMLEMGESRMMASTGRPAAANRAVMESDGRLLQNATSFTISQWIQYAKRAAVHTHSGSCYLPIFYFAYSTARLSRMTLTLIWPG
jgi:hypothetical protein